MNTEELDKNTDEIVTFITQTLKKLKTESDINQLNADRKLFRKYVPFGMRSYFASYLIRSMAGDGKLPYENKKRSVTKISLDPSVSTTLFFNVGKMRKVFHKDIIYLIMRNTGITRENIGEIKIHDNYSFVQVSNEVVQTVIDKLNSMPYRGRELVVNIANNKTDTDSAVE